MRFIQRICPRYGNWGGPGWSGGTFPAEPKDTNWSVDSKDSLDQLFKEHDRRYQDAIVEFRNDGTTHAEMMRAFEGADKILVAEVGALSSNPRKWERPAKSSWYARVYRYLVLGSFYPKIWIM